MKHLSLFLFFASAALAQRWEMGIGAGAGFYTSQTLNSAGGASASAGLAPAAAITAHIGQDMYRRIGGEVRYTWQMSQLKLSSGGQNVRFGAQSHAVEYDAMIHFGGVEANVRPYVMLGGGMKLFQGTGAEQIVQPLNQFAYLTQTSEWKPMLSAGAGVKYRVGRKTLFRIEARDQMTPFPGKLIAPSNGSTPGGWLHDFLILAGLSYSF